MRDNSINALMIVAGLIALPCCFVGGPILGIVVFFIVCIIGLIKMSR